MSRNGTLRPTRRSFIAGAAAAVTAGPALAQQSVNNPVTTEVERDLSKAVRHNISSFRSMEWQPYFDSLKKGAILVDITSREAPTMRDLLELDDPADCARSHAATGREPADQG